MQSFYKPFSSLPFRRSSALVLVAMLLFAGVCTRCKDDDSTNDPSVEAIERTWVLTGGTITKDAVDVTEQYPGMTIAFSASGTYTARNAGGLFEAVGTWVWADASATALVLDDGLEVSVLTLNATDLHLAFTVADEVSGRTEHTGGDYVVKLKAGN
jgi:hypothetical protein